MADIEEILGGGSLSAFISDALRQRVQSHYRRQILAEYDRERGPIPADEVAAPAVVLDSHGFTALAKPTPQGVRLLAGAEGHDRMPQHRTNCRPSQRTRPRHSHHRRPQRPQDHRPLID
ncbi:MAG: hypothetical protein LBU05_04615 [Bifidobacteriaceae bacterium]|nr:hypothetical protein [Bifidobacteriaceae bacterium]